MTKYTFNLRAPSIKSLKVKRPSKRVVLVAALTAVVLCALIGSLATYEKHRQAEHDQAVAAAQAQTKADATAKQVARQQQEDFKAAVARGDSACAYIRTLATARTTARLVSVPVTCK